MAQPQSTRQASPPEPTLYFAFGSNLSLAQMATRCPHSLYIGRAVLHDYLWQINTRGFANVVPCPGHSVQGLVYQIDPADEASLDRSEGVSRACYAKGRCGVDLYPAPQALYRRPTAFIVGKGGPRSMLERALLLGGEGDITETGPICDVRVLVYIDPLRVEWGEPREEYVGRINTGIRDAVTLGVSREYVDEVMRPSVPGESLVLARETKPRGGAASGRRERERPEGEAAGRRRQGGSGRERAAGRSAQRRSWGGTDRSASPPRRTAEERGRSRRVSFARYIWRPIWIQSRRRSR